MADELDQLIQQLRSLEMNRDRFRVSKEGARKLIEDYIRQHARWPPAQPIRDAPQPRNPRDVTYLLGFIPDLVSPHTNPKAGLSVFWYEPNVQGGCWCSDAGEDVKPTIFWELPEVKP